MKNAISLRSISLSKRISFTAVFATLCCISTLLITVPLPASGFFNTGDVFVLLAGWCLGPIYGVIAASVGSALADIIIGYALYAPATFIIKGFVAFIAYMLAFFLQKLIKKDKLDFLSRVLSALVGEGVMVLGYFLFESILYTFVGAIPNLLGNALQGGCCLVLATLLITAFRPIKSVRQFFPLLFNEK